MPVNVRMLGKSFILFSSFPIDMKIFFRGILKPDASIDVRSASAYELPNAATSPVDAISTCERGSAPFILL